MLLYTFFFIFGKSIGVNFQKTSFSCENGRYTKNSEKGKNKKKKEKEDLRYILLHESNDYIDNTSVK